MLRRLFELVVTLSSLITLAQSVPNQVNWNAHSDMRTGQQVMWTSTGTSFYRAIDTPISYFIVYSSDLPDTRSAGVGIVGFNTVIGYDYAVNTTVQNFTVHSLRITARVYGDTTLSFFSVNWIAIGNLMDMVQILFNCHLCTNLKVGRGDRSESRTGVTLFTGYSQLFVNVYLAGFSLRNVDGITNYLKASATIGSGSNIINYQFSVNQNNTVTQICYTTIIFCQICTQVKYYDWGTADARQLTNANDPSILPFPGDIDYQSEDKMFFGMSAFNLSRASRRVFYLNTDEYNPMTVDYTTNEGTYAVMMDFFWMAVRSCDDNNDQFIVYNKSCRNGGNCGNNNTLYSTNLYNFCAGCHITCKTCSTPLSTGCTDCYQVHFRKLNGASPDSCVCNTSYIDIGDPLCYPCQNFIPGCDVCVSTFLCTSCFPGFVLQPSGICQCASGFLVSGSCTNITGCTSLVEYGGTVFCTACNSTLHFQTTTTYLCECMSGYYLSVNQQCLSTCGDSKQIAEQSCDDGNIIDGDGCSSSCMTEYKWICLGGTPITPSTCYIYDPDLKMVIKYVRRVTYMNRMQVGIRFVPNYSQFSSTNFKQYLSHTVPSTNFNATFVNGELLLEVDYNQTIQGLFYNLSLKLDPNLFYNTTLSVQIPTSGMNTKLTYDSNNSINNPLEIIIIVLDVLAIIVMFASCVSERMIGIEMIQTIQTVLYAQTVMKTTPSSFSPLQMLRYSSGFNEVQGVNYDRTYTFAFSLSSVGLEKQFLLSYNVTYILMIAVIVLCCILKAKQNYHESRIGKFTHDEDQLKNQQKFTKTTKIYNFIFERILFLMVFMSMFLVVFALMLQLSDMSGDYWVMSKQFNMLSAIIGIAIISTMTCAVILNGCFPGTLIFPMLMKQYYPPIYFIYQSAFIFILAFDYTQEYVLYILAAMSLIFLFYNLIHQPYPEKFHTFVLVFHQLFIIGVIGVYVFENLTKPTEHEVLYKILNAVIVVLLYIVVGLNAYRLYRYYRFLQKNGWDQYGNQIEGAGQSMPEDLSYKQLKTPKPYYNEDKMQRAKNTDNAAKKKKYEEPTELQQLKQLKKSANKDAAKSKPVQDESEMNWKYNKLADEDNQGTRFQATNRDARPDTNRDKPLARTKTLDKNLNDNYVSFNENNKNNPNYDDENTLRNIDSGNKGRNDGNEDDDHAFDNPYDQNGYVKKSAQTPKRANDDDDEDPLQAIKRKLKQDFNSKLKTSTLKQF